MPILILIVAIWTRQLRSGRTCVRLIGGTSLNLRFLPLVASCNFTTELSIFQNYNRTYLSKQQGAHVKRSDLIKSRV
jgi:hypothetical protein